ALELADALERRAAELQISVAINSGVSRLIDCGASMPGGLEAGLMLARICLAGLGNVTLTPGRADLWPGPAVQVTTDHPVAACMASQYAGWQLSEGKYFAMGSGPMRAARGQNAEALFDDIGH